jgi:hypothetical protein
LLYLYAVFVLCDCACQLWLATVAGHLQPAELYIAAAPTAQSGGTNVASSLQDGIVSISSGHYLPCCGLPCQG